MGCACKAGQYVRNTKRYFDGKTDTKTDLKFNSSMKNFFKAILAILVVVLGIPFILVYAFLRKFVFRQKTFNVLNMIRIKI